KLSSVKYNDLVSIKLLNNLMKELNSMRNDDYNLLTLGNFLLDSGQYKTAENYYQIFLDELLLSSTIVDSNINKLKGILYNNMAVCRYEQNDYKVALKYYNEYTEILKSNFVHYDNNDKNHLYKSYIEKSEKKLKQQIILKLLLNKNCSSSLKIVNYYNMAYNWCCKSSWKNVSSFFFC
ncbi:unnamed protein product, partial [Didymodactylos carnosus]